MISSKMSSKYPRVSLIITAAFAVEALLSPLRVCAQIAVPGIPERQALALAPDKGAIYRIHGKVTAIDPIAKTITIGNKAGSKTMAISQYSVLIKNGAATSFSNVAIADEADGIAGMVFNKFTAISLRFGPYRGDLPYGIPVPNKPGYVTSPYRPRVGLTGYVDVRGIPAGMEAKDPYSGKIFLVPKQ